MPPPDASRELYRLLQRLQLILVLAGRRSWARMDPDDFDASWREIAPALVAVTAAGQLAAARAAASYVPAVLAETEQPDRPLVRVRPEAFAGRASDGRSLAGLLTGAVVHSKLAARDLPAGEALDRGGRWLDQALRTATTDAARDVTQAEIVVREGMGYVRMLNPPSCSRCTVLAGKWYRHNDIMPRHPGCDCGLIPALENVAGDFTTDARQMVDRGLVTDLTKAQKQRLDDGADLSKVLNESRDRWRERMAADRRSARRANYTPAEARAADRRAAARVASGEDIKTVHDFMASLTSQVEAARAMRVAGIAD